ncbi:unnamed protein product [Gongylonema pulchrum]|uniref:Uncharacterized protein n=1 Tax=Gongylonema pulchrum TaxID=637853 RepID=A0A183EQ50_9BILA|nr:unnamed protein product [Gongylonema pulchrum]
MARHHRFEAALAAPSSRRHNAHHCQNGSHHHQSKTSLIGGGSPPPVNSRDFVVIRLRQNNAGACRMGKAHSVCHGLHLSASAPRFTYSHVRSPDEHSWNRQHLAAPPPLLKCQYKRSSDSGQTSTLFSSAALLAKSPSGACFYRPADGVLAS